MSRIHFSLGVGSEGTRGTVTRPKVAHSRGKSPRGAARPPQTSTHTRLTPFVALLAAAGVPAPVPEYRFHPTRKWRWDYAWPDAKVALEVDGGVWTQGKHGRGSGIVKDHEKRNQGARLGWRLLVVTPKQLTDLQTIALITSTLYDHGMGARP